MPLLSKEKPARPRLPKNKRAPSKKKTESIEKWLAAMDKDDPLRKDLESQLEQLRAALKDPRNPGARLDSAMAKMRKAKAKVQKCEEQLRQAEASLYAAHAEEEEASSELTAAQENAVPKQPELPPGDAAMQLASEDINDLTDMLKHGGMRRRLRGACQKGPNRPIQLPTENFLGDCKISKSSFGGKTGKQRQHFAGCGEEWWGWIIGRDTPWGSRGPPRALPPPPPPNPAAPVPPTPPLTPPGGRTDPKETVKDTETQIEPAQCADARLNLPRERTPSAHLHSSARASSEVFRKPFLSKLWFILMLTLSSPGSRAGTDATPFQSAVTGHSLQGIQCGLAPGDVDVDRPPEAVPILRCSEHAQQSMQSSKESQNVSSSQRGRRTSHKQEGTQEHLSRRMVPGTHVMRTGRQQDTHMSDMIHSYRPPMVQLGTSLSPIAVNSGLLMPGMSHVQHSFSYTCSHVGYTSAVSRLETCPGQSAHTPTDRSETCPGQRARSKQCRFATCPGQCARKSHSRQAACSEQSAQTAKSNCPGQRDRNMAQSRERGASIDDALEELKFWTFSIGCKNLRDCLREVPRSWRSFDVHQSDWWKEPGLTERRQTLRELTTCENTHVVDTRCLRDTEGSASRHLGTNVINMRGVCHNANMKGLIKDIWTCIEDLLPRSIQTGKARKEN